MAKGDRLGERMGRLADCLTGMTRTAVLSTALLLAPFVVTALPGDGGAAYAQAANISEIAVRGNQRIEEGTIRSYMELSVGSPYDPQLADQSIKQLFATGLFADISISLDGSRLIVSVVENPI